MDHIQHDAEAWRQLLWASGGLLELAKSTYFLVIWSFTEAGKLRILTDQDIPPNTVCVTDATGRSTALTRVLANDGIKMLGIKTAATLYNQDEFDYLMDKTTTYNRATSACPLRPHEA
eukprot:1812184-Ditylum_brightwellii.AAC.1